MSQSTKPTSPLRQRLIEDMTLRKISPRTQSAYIRVVANLTRFLRGDFLEKVGFFVEKLIFRGRYHQLVAQSIIRILPTLRPFGTIVARKP